MAALFFPFTAKFMLVIVSLTTVAILAYKEIAALLTKSVVI